MATDQPRSDRWSSALRALWVPIAVLPSSFAVLYSAGALQGGSRIAAYAAFVLTALLMLGVLELMSAVRQVRSLIVMLSFAVSIALLTYALGSSADVAFIVCGFALPASYVFDVLVTLGLLASSDKPESEPKSESESN